MDWKRAKVLGECVRGHSGSQIRVSSYRDLHMRFERWIGFYVVDSREIICKAHNLWESPTFGSSRKFITLFFFNFIFFYFLNFKIFNSYMHSQTWTPLPPPSPQHLSGSSPCFKASSLSSGVCISGRVINDRQNDIRKGERHEEGKRYRWWGL